jgi:DNA replication protein DnaC
LKQDIATLEASEATQVSSSDELQKKRRRLLLCEEGERYYTDLDLNNLRKRKSASLKDLQLLDGGRLGGTVRQVDYEADMEKLNHFVYGEVVDGVQVGGLKAGQLEAFLKIRARFLSDEQLLMFLSGGGGVGKSHVITSLGLD